MHPLGFCILFTNYSQRQVAASNHRVAAAKIRTLSHDGGVRIYLYLLHQTTVLAPKSRVATAEIRTLPRNGRVRIYLYSWPSIGWIWCYIGGYRHSAWQFTNVYIQMLSLKWRTWLAVWLVVQKIRLAICHGRPWRMPHCFQTCLDLAFIKSKGKSVPFFLKGISLNFEV